MNNIIKNTLSTNSFWMVNKALAKYFGDNDCALFLADLLSKHRYFESTDQLDDGFFFNTQDNIYDDTNIPHKRQLQYVKKLEALKIIATKKAGLPAKTYYKIDFEAIEEILAKQESSKRLDCSSQNDQAEVAKMAKLDTSKPPINNNKYNKNKHNNNKETILTQDNALDSNCDLVISEWNKVNSTSLKSKREFRENLGFWLSEGYTIDEILYAIRRKVLVPDKFLKDITIVTFFRKSNSQGPCNYIEQVLNYKLGEADGTKQRPDEHVLEMREFGETRYTIADLGSDRIDYLNEKGFELEKATGFIKRKEDGYTKSYIVYADGTLKDLID